MTRAITEPSSPALDDRARPGGNGRLAGLALMAGCVLATLGFLGVSLTMHGPEAGWPTDPLWQPVYGVALAGNLLVVLGLPAILAVHGGGARRLTLVGYVGIFAPLAMLIVAETTIEAFREAVPSHARRLPRRDTGRAERVRGGGARAARRGRAARPAAA